MYTAMKSIFEDKNRQEALFFEGPGKDLDVRAHTRPQKYGVISSPMKYLSVCSDCSGGG